MVVPAGRTLSSLESCRASHTMASERPRKENGVMADPRFAADTSPQPSPAAAARKPQLCTMLPSNPEHCEAALLHQRTSIAIASQ